MLAQCGDDVTTCQVFVGFYQQMVADDLLPICEPWCWNIYQHLPYKWPSFVGKYTSTMEHMGWWFLGDFHQLSLSDHGFSTWNLVISITERLPNHWASSCPKTVIFGQCQQGDQISCSGSSKEHPIHFFVGKTWWMLIAFKPVMSLDMIDWPPFWNPLVWSSHKFTASKSA
jgi:hypothetical protein